MCIYIYIYQIYKLYMYTHIPIVYSITVKCIHFGDIWLVTKSKFHYILVV